MIGARQCAWFGCTSVATATYTFDSDACTVWLDTPRDGGARAGELCHRHARSLKPPRGWRLEDRRPSVTPEPLPSNRDRFDAQADELRTLLDAHSPLLARAFRSSGTV